MRASCLVLWLVACGSDNAAPGPDAAPLPDDASELPTADQLLARIASCDEVVGGPFTSDEGDVDLCGFPGAVVWTADMDIDCDGKMSEQCNLETDPNYMDQTAAVDSNGDPLDSATLPFAVIPGRSARFDYIEAGLGMRSVVAVIFDGKLQYGPLGDVGPQAIIGEASYAMAVRLGIDPDPSTGGVPGGVTYIAFTGDESKVEVIEDQEEAVALGVDRAKLLLDTP